MSVRFTIAAAATLLTTLLFAQNDTVSTDDVKVPQEAVVVLSPTQGHQVAGTLLLKQTKEGVRVTGKVSGIKPGKHGFHIHQYGDLRDPQGKSAGGHFNPEDTKHGGPDAAKHHAGDLGNITANAEGTATVDKLAKGLKLHLIIGRSVVVHNHADDLKSQPSGDAGPRIALGVIGLADIKQFNVTSASK